jgi:hypothetical protein
VLKHATSVWLLTFAAVPVRYHQSAALDHSLQLGQEHLKVRVVHPAELVQPRVVGVHIHQLLADERGRLPAHKLLVLSGLRSQKHSQVNTPVCSQARTRPPCSRRSTSCHTRRSCARSRSTARADQGCLSAASSAACTCGPRPPAAGRASPATARMLPLRCPGTACPGRRCLRQRDEDRCSGVHGQQ